jgi:hypothetical protein
MDGTESLGAGAPVVAGGSDAAIDADAISLTTRPVVDLLSVLQQTLALVDLRAMNLTAIILASLIALWTQLHAFAAGAPAALAWTAWGIIVAALLVMARVILPHRLVKLSDSVLGWTKVPCRFEPAEEAQLLARASTAFREELMWLRKHMLVATALGVVALLEVVVGYVVQKA